MPLSVDYLEKYYAAGKIPGGFIKRETRPKDKEILVSRFIDRPLRPLFSKTFKREIQVLPIDDPLPEGKETVVLTLVPPPVLEPGPVDTLTAIYPAPAPYRVGPNYRATVVILDNDLSDNLPPRVAIVSPTDGAVFTAPPLLDYVDSWSLEHRRHPSLLKNNRNNTSGVHDRSFAI